MSVRVERDFSQVRDPSLAECLTRIDPLVQQIDQWPFPATRLYKFFTGEMFGGSGEAQRRRVDSLYTLVRDTGIITLKREQEEEGGPKPM